MFTTLRKLPGFLLIPAFMLATSSAGASGPADYHVTITNITF